LIPIITADCGGSNGDRARLRKACLQKRADEIRLTLRFHHYSPTTPCYPQPAKERLSKLSVRAENHYDKSEFREFRRSDRPLEKGP
jgi:hypothetical protein